MTDTFSIPAFAAAGGRSRSPWLALLMAIAALALALNATAQAPVAPSGTAPPLPAESLDALVGRIALYPDDLVAIILPASTNPLQIVQADRFLDKRKTEPKLPLDDKWDDAVKTLLNYPDIVKSMSADLDWTSELGEAVVADLGAVMEAVQAFRRKAQAAGNLKSDDKQVIVVEKEVITIAPADPQVIYVPQYNPTTVVTYGVSPYYYGYYPTPYPSYYYPYAPGAAFAAGVIWGAAIGAAWGGNRYGYGGGGNTININRNTNINTGNIGGGASQRPASGGGGSQWSSNKKPGQVSSSVGKTAPSSRVGDSRGGSAGGASQRPSTGATGGGASQRPSTGATGGGASTRPSTGATGGGSSANRSGGSGGAAFDSYGSGRQASSNSSRGASSSRSMSSGGGGGGARSSGGGGGSRGGGGGGGGRRR